MRLSSITIVATTFLLAGLLAVLAGGQAADRVQALSESGVRDELDRAGLDWAEVEAHGLQVYLSGTAPSEGERFRAMSSAGRVVDAARVIDAMDVQASGPVEPPRFLVEILRNASGISLIGLVPTGDSRQDTLDALAEKIDNTPVSDFLETADYAAPKGWADALGFAIDALALLPRSKISVEAARVEITAIADSAEQKRRWETQLARTAPDAVQLALDISAPRAVITPFVTRFVMDDSGARFDACAAATDIGRATILGAAAKAGAEGKLSCTIGLGVPSATWPEAVRAGIEALAEIGAGTVTLSDADVTLNAAQGTDPALFDRVVGELEAALPDLYVLTATLPPPPDTAKVDAGPPEFTATRSPEGQVQLRGRLKDDLARATADSVAKARFGAGAVYNATRLDAALPVSWNLRVLLGLDALAQLSNGVVRVTPTEFVVRGNTGNPDASADIAGLLSDKLGAGGNYQIDVTYQEALDPVAGLPTADECIDAVNGILSLNKITFEPGSATVDVSARDTIDSIAAVLTDCSDFRIEIGGHTDSQGRESMNQQLSQQRAEAVLNELRQRRVLTASFSARGYGEEVPIADNDTEEGREANRRIEFRLIPTEPVAEEETTLESLAQTGEDGTEGAEQAEDAPDGAEDSGGDTGGDE